VERFPVLFQAYPANQGYSRSIYLMISPQTDHRYPTCGGDFPPRTLMHGWMGLKCLKLESSMRGVVKKNDYTVWFFFKKNMCIIWHELSSGMDVICAKMFKIKSHSSWLVLMEVNKGQLLPYIYIYVFFQFPLSFNAWSTKNKSLLKRYVHPHRTLLMKCAWWSCFHECLLIRNT
jgi:hypothetical protein